MNAKAMFDATTDAALRSLDPVSPRSPENLSEDERAAASATLTRVLASEPSPARAPEADVDHRHRRQGIALITVVAAATVIVLGVGISLPGAPAYAGWSPTPVALTATEANAAMATCTSENLDYIDPRMSKPRLFLAERRGGWTYVLYAPTSRTEASCLFPPDPENQGEYRWGKFDDEPNPEPAPLPEDVEEMGSAVATTKEGLFSWTEGMVGRDVTAVTITTPVGAKIVASVANGRYAAWWPAGENQHENPQLHGGIGVDATLRDGTTKVIQTR